jgi:hypothetical protein
MYSNLETDRSIRLLSLLPAKDSHSPLEGLIGRVELDTIPHHPYEALSYVWGSPEPSDEIFIDGCLFRVTSNLGKALRRLRQTQEPRTLWIDAICINQADTTERASQVQLMGDIYKQASRVVAYLADLDEGMDSTTPGEISRLSITKYRGEDVENILRDPWWSRVWVIQEAAFADPLVFIIGTKETDGSDLLRQLDLHHASKDTKRKQHRNPLRHSDVQRRLPVHAGLPRHLPIRPDMRDTLAVAKYLRQRLSNVGLLELLERSRGYKTTDPRDKIYAVLGLASDSQALGVRPDYSKSKVEVFAGVAAAIIAHSRSLHVLSYAHKTPSQISDTKYNQFLPSWVPDWTQRLPIAPLWSNWFDASRGAELQFKPRAESSKLHLAATMPCSVAGVYESPWLALGYPDLDVDDEDDEKLVNHGKDMFLKMRGWALSVDEPICPDDVHASVFENDDSTRILHSGENLSSGNRDTSAKRPVGRGSLVDPRKYWLLLVQRRLMGVMRNWRKVMKAVTDESSGNASFHLDSNIDAPVRKAGGGEDLLKTKKDASASMLSGDGCPLDDALRCWACAGVTFKPDGKWTRYEPRATENMQPIYDPRLYFISVALRVGQRRAFFTDQGNLGIGPRALAPGDRIAVFPGGRVPLALRQSTENPNGFVLVGECYVLGMMDGEAMSSGVCLTEMTLT